MSETPEKQLTVVIPAFNEAQTIRSVVQSIQQKCSEIVKEIIVVDDGSSDDTAPLAAETGCRVVRHYKNLGYGASLKAGIRLAQTEYLLTMDSDGQHRAEDVLKLWKSVGTADMVVGERTDLLHSPLWRMPGKWLLSAMANYLSRHRIQDLNSGLRLIRREVVLKYLHLCPSGFSFSTTITLALMSRGWNVAYVPIEVNHRSGKSSVSVTTGLGTIVLILRIITLFDPLRIFISASALIGLAGILWAIPFAMAARGISIGAMLAIVTSVLLFGLGLLCDQVSQLRLERFE